jgi:hypothetical protein
MKESCEGAAFIAALPYVWPMLDDVKKAWPPFIYLFYELNLFFIRSVHIPSDSEIKILLSHQP